MFPSSVYQHWRLQVFTPHLSQTIEDQDWVVMLQIMSYTCGKMRKKKQVFSEFLTELGSSTLSRLLYIYKY